MSSNKSQCCVTIIATVGMVLFLSAASAVELSFTIDPAQSVMTATAFVNRAGAPTIPQGPGADTASYSGTISVFVDNALAPTSIQFLAAEAIAGISGSWLPEVDGGTVGGAIDGDADPGQPEDANYGVVLNQGFSGRFLGAFRETVMSADGPSQPVSNGMFSSTQHWVATAGALDTNVSSISFGDFADRIPVTGDEAFNAHATPGTYAVDCDTGVTTLTLPVDLDFLNPLAVDFFFDGQVVGNLTPIPGDANLDRIVDDADFAIWDQNKFSSNTGWCTADFNGDNVSDGADFNIWNEQYAAAGANVAVPEPTGIRFLIFVLFAVVRFFRR